MPFGVTIPEFWEMTIGDIKLFMESTAERLKRERREGLSMNYNLASIILTFIGCSLNKKPIPKFEVLYPDEQDKLTPEQTARKFNFELQQFANSFNNRLKGN